MSSSETSHDKYGKYKIWDGRRVYYKYEHELTLRSGKPRYDNYNLHPNGTHDHKFIGYDISRGGGQHYDWDIDDDADPRVHSIFVSDGFTLSGHKIPEANTQYVSGQYLKYRETPKQYEERTGKPFIPMQLAWSPPSQYHSVCNKFALYAKWNQWELYGTKKSPDGKYDRQELIGTCRVGAAAATYITSRMLDTPWDNPSIKINPPVLEN